MRDCPWMTCGTRSCWTAAGGPVGPVAAGLAPEDQWDPWLLGWSLEDLWDPQLLGCPRRPNPLPPHHHH